MTISCLDSECRRALLRAFRDVEFIQFRFQIVRRCCVIADCGTLRPVTEANYGQGLFSTKHIPLLPSLLNGYWQRKLVSVRLVTRLLCKRLRHAYQAFGTHI